MKRNCKAISVSVLLSTLVLISLNTSYSYASNAVVDADLGSGRNTIDSTTDNSGIIGAKNSITNAQYTSVIGTNNSVSNANGSGVNGGNNLLSGLQYSLVYGSYNTVTDTIGVGVVGGGNTVTNSTASSLVAANSTLSDATLSSIIGYNNTITDNSANAGITGSNNTIENSSDASVIGVSNTITGGNNNRISGSNNTITNGSYNIVEGFSNTLGETLSNNQIIANNATVADGVSNSVIIGTTVTVAAGNTTAVGAHSSAISDSASAYGINAGAFGSNSTAVGANSSAIGADSTAVGAGSSAALDGSVAVGSNSVANVIAGTSGYLANGNTSSTWVSTAAAVSVGNASEGVTRQITSVAAGTEDTDAVNVAQLKAAESTNTYRFNTIYNKFNTMDNRINRVGAGAAALAGLHPLDFDPDDKWDFAAGYGNYRGTNAAAVGAFYRPNEDTLFSVGGSFSGGENMVNAGISLKLGQGNHVSTSRVAMATEIKDLRNVVKNLILQVNELTKSSGGRLEHNERKADFNTVFPDVPENHWAYEYIKELGEQGLIQGYPDGEFKGNRAMTRYEFATMLARAIQAGLNLQSNANGAQLLYEFTPELTALRNESFRIDRISGKDTDKAKVNRIRVNNTEKNRDIYGSILSDNK